MSGTTSAPPYFAFSDGLLLPFLYGFRMGFLGMGDSTELALHELPVTLAWR
jgi:hypothetical protein